MPFIQISNTHYKLLPKSIRLIGSLLICLLAQFAFAQGPLSANEQDLAFAQVHSGFYTVANDARIDLDSSLFITSKWYKLSRVPVITEGFRADFETGKCGWMNNDHVDSAKTALSGLKGMEHTKLALLIGAYYAFHSGFDKRYTNLGIAYLTQAKNESDKLHRADWSAECACLLSKCYFKQQNIPEGKKWAETVTNNVSLATYKTLNAKAWNYAGMYCPFTAETGTYRINCLQKALGLYIQLNDRANQINTLMNIAYINFAVGNLNQSKAAAMRSLSIQKASQFKYTQYTYDLLAYLAAVSSNNATLLEMAYAAYNSAEHSKDTVEMGHFYGRVAFGLSNLRNTDEYLKWEKKAFDFYRKHGGGDGNFWRLLQTNFDNGVGSTAENLSLIKNTWKLHAPTNDIDRQTAYISLGICYDNLKRYNLAQKYYAMANKLEAANIVTRGGMKNNQLTFLLGQSYYYMANYTQSRRYMQTLLKASSTGTFDKLLLKSVYNMMHRLDSVNKDYKSALRYFNMYANLGDTLAKANDYKQILDLNIKYETLQKEKNLQQLRAQHILELQKEAFTKKIGFGGFALLLFVIAMLYSRYYFNKKKNLRLEAQKVEIDLQNYALKNLNDKQKVLLTEKEWLLREIHHRVKNNLQTTMSLLNIQSAYIDNDVALATIRNSQRRMHTMSLIHQKLYQSEKLTTIDMAVYIKELTAYLKESFPGTGNINFELHTQPISLDISQAVPVGLIINEAVTNALKYAFPTTANGTISIFFTLDARPMYILIIQDNGAGLPEWFNDRPGSSLGMTLMKGLSDQLQGEIEIQSPPGTRITITFEPAELVPPND
jgi:two-component sensor histidine kinase